MSALTTETVYEELLKKITAGEYPPGMRLIEQSLADEMEVGGASVHDALRRLTDEDLVEQIAGQGVFVREFTSKDIIKLYTFREQMEVFAVSEAADNIQAHQQRGLEEISDAMGKLAAVLERSDPNAVEKKLVHEFHTLDMAFHAAIFQASDNEWLRNAAERTRLLANASRCKRRDRMPDDPAVTIAEHREIAGAIASGDAFLGGDIMSRHIRRSMDSLLRSLGENGA